MSSISRLIVGEPVGNQLVSFATRHTGYESEWQDSDWTCVVGPQEILVWLQLLVACRWVS